MAKLISMIKTIRRNWKKSTVGFLALAYGCSYGVERYKISRLMRAYCEEAMKYGEQPLPQLNKARHVTVILNPTARKSKAKSLYEKYAAPLLHLAGLRVSLILTENEGQAIDLMEIMGNTDAVVIAGGNGTLHEAVTGLLRRPEYQENVSSSMPMGILPIGRTNTAAKALFNASAVKDAQWIAESAMAVIKESTQAIDVIKVERSDDKPLFAVCGFELGSFVNLEATLPKYWYYGFLKAKLIYMYNSLKKCPVIDDVELEYVSPCDGCSKCYKAAIEKKNSEQKRWWSAFVPKTTSQNKSRIDYSKVVNEECGTWCKKNSPFSNIAISTSLKQFLRSHTSENALWMNLYSSNLSIKNYIKTGLAYHEGKSSSDVSDVLTTIPVGGIRLIPSGTQERSCYIDSELYDFKPFSLSLLPKHLVIYR